jgi:hypothetical protein
VLPFLLTITAMTFTEKDGSGSITVSAQLATYASLSFEGGQVIAEFQGVPGAGSQTGFTRDVWTLSDVMLASGEGRLTVDERGLRVIPWPLLPLPPLPGDQGERPMLAGVDP